MLLQIGAVLKKDKKKKFELDLKKELETKRGTTPSLEMNGLSNVSLPGSGSLGHERSHLWFELSPGLSWIDDRKRKEWLDFHGSVCIAVHSEMFGFGILYDSRGIRFDKVTKAKEFHEDLFEKIVTIGKFFIVPEGNMKVSEFVLSKARAENCKTVFQLATCVAFFSSLAYRIGVNTDFGRIHHENEYVIGSIVLNYKGEFQTPTIIKVEKNFKWCFARYAIIGRGAQHAISDMEAPDYDEWNDMSLDTAKTTLVQACSKAIREDVYCGGPLEWVSISRRKTPNGGIQLDVENELIIPEDYLEEKGIHTVI